MEKFKMNELVNILNKAIEGIENRNQKIDDFTKRTLAWNLLDMHHEDFSAYEVRINELMERLDYTEDEDEINLFSNKIDEFVDEQEVILNQLLSKTKKVS